MRDPYHILGVLKNASQEDIKKAYRALAKKYHPDLSPGNKQNETRFKEISNAYDLIGTPESRAKYDRGESDELNANTYSDSFKERNKRRTYTRSFNDEDIFEQFFSNSFQRKSKIKNRDVHYEMEIDFKDSITGTEKILTMTNGKKIRVKIPPGINSGTKLRFTEMGEANDPNSPPGDAFIEIKVKPLEGWSKEGNDVITELPISFIEAILGTELSVQTVLGPVLLKVPAGVSSGFKLRLKGKGVQSSHNLGNQIVTIKIVSPKSISSELKRSIQEWNGKFDYNPR